MAAPHPLQTRRSTSRARSAINQTRSRPQRGQRKKGHTYPADSFSHCLLSSSSVVAFIGVGPKKAPIEILRRLSLAINLSRRRVSTYVSENWSFNSSLRG